MTTYEGLSSATRARLEAQARQISGPLLITLHKASHLKNSSLVSGGAGSAPYATLCFGIAPDTAPSKLKSPSKSIAAAVAPIHVPAAGPKYQTLVRRGGGPHPSFEQQFLFNLGAMPAAGLSDSAIAASATGPHDGLLHVRLFDRSARGDECIGRLDVNLVQLLAPEGSDVGPPNASSRPQTAAATSPTASPASPAPASLQTEGITRWLAVRDASNARVTAGWLCITANFKGTGLPLEWNIAGVANEAASASRSAASPAAPASSPLASSPVLSPHASDVHSLLTSPRSSPSITLSLPNPLQSGVATPIPPPNDAASAYFSPPSDGWPVPRPSPPAPGYPAAAAAPASSPVRALASASPAPHAASSFDAADDDAVQSTLSTAFDERHEHILQLLPRLASGRFICSVCLGEGFGSVYQCAGGCGDFHIHEQCLREREPEEHEQEEEEAEEVAAAAAAASAASLSLSPSRPRTGAFRPVGAPDMRVDRRHPHPLTWVAELYDGTFQCAGCGGGGSGPAWHCQACGKFDLHCECMR